MTEAACWAHGRRKLFNLAEVARAPLAAEAVRWIESLTTRPRGWRNCCPGNGRKGLPDWPPEREGRDVRD
ncbi:IS66 family transposase [Humitalea rosea]|uniref:IS66 family transposase n=1 Tax=Humitalea rosea TaxID=990373 RepID=UPI001FEC8CA6|nr:transposase [Humitalea rosea]